MNTLLQPLFILLLFVLVRCADLSISSAIARDPVRYLTYCVVAVLALIAAVVMLLGEH